jgi:hypothetical protein
VLAFTDGVASRRPIAFWSALQSPFGDGDLHDRLPSLQERQLRRALLHKGVVVRCIKQSRLACLASQLVAAKGTQAHR